MVKYYFSSYHIIALEDSINYKFKNLDLIHEALSHPSLKQNDTKWPKDYERFEILGDSILGFLITEILFNKYQKSDEGSIAKIKAYLVSKDTLCRVAGKINLADFILMAKGEEHSGGRINPSNIENTMEALIAAIYIDSNIDQTRVVIKNLWSELLDNFDINQMDPKTVLQEWSQSKQYGIPNYEIIEKAGKSHTPNFKVSVIIGDYKEIGYGKSIKNAEKAAAKKLLDRLGI